MRKFSVIIGAMLALLVSALPAQADHDQDYYPGQRWNDSANETYCLDGFAGPLTDGEYTNMVSSTVNRVNHLEAPTTDISTDWTMAAGVECANSYDFLLWQCHEIRQQLPNMSSRISYENLNGDDRARTKVCDLDANGNLDFFWVVIDLETSNFNLHWNVFSIPSDGQWDFSGLLMHEMIHVSGWLDHFPATSEACTVAVGLYNTMCANSDLGIRNFGSSNGTWWRTMESHDIGEINQTYP